MLKTDWDTIFTQLILVTVNNTIFTELMLTAVNDRIFTKLMLTTVTDMIFTKFVLVIFTGTIFTKLGFALRRSTKISYTKFHKSSTRGHYHDVSSQQRQRDKDFLFNFVKNAWNGITGYLLSNKGHVDQNRRTIFGASVAAQKLSRAEAMLSVWSIDIC